ncbi:hypothetical protein [Rhodoferax fermentans]|uniref:Uncharacterized protein n=1 Tax=Rhodoferax fermentans TaxID=28066 RepID=A0A1T1AUW3_RHOFE|nr:hypothetical protein [Rhodoferax fermentans]MBK1685726.1 hypothetical protein [Rhodoferax fermentans]OOV07906.1 hypothetical protein RF819_15300 [Rhodoferax fermentans]
MDIVKTITDWPVIVQGALGSALFWAILEIGQRGVRKFAARLGSDKKTANWFALAAHETSGEVGAQARFFCLYGAMHYVLKGLVVTVLSWAVSPLLDIFAAVGYLIATYFFFRALAFVPHTASLGPIAERRQRFKESIAEMKSRQDKEEASTTKNAL